MPLLPLLVTGLSCVSLSCGGGGSDVGQTSGLSPQNFPASPVLSWTPSSSAQALTPPAKTIPTGASANVLDFGAKCDGSSDDRAAIQRALDSVVVLQFPAGATCVVNASGLTIQHFGAVHFYALKIPSNRALYLNGAMLKLGNGQNAHLMINADILGGGNSNIAILGPGTIDLNKANQTSPPSGEQSGGFMDLVTDLTMRDLTFRNVRQYALRHFRITRGFYDKLVCTDSDGSGFSFGVEYIGGPTETYFGHLEGHNALGTASRGSLGNPFIAHGANNTLVSFVGTGNHFGFKLQDGSSNWTIGSIRISGTTGDKGVKIQSSPVLRPNRQISIEEITTSGNYYEGLYIWVSDDVAIGKVVSEGDGASAATAAIKISPNANRISIRSISVQGAKAGGVSIEGTDIEIGELYAKNNGALVGGQSNVTVRDTARRVKIGSLITVDDQKPPKVNHGLNVLWGSSDVNVESALTVGSFLANPLANSGFNALVVEDKEHIKAFADGDAAPSVKGGTLFKTANSKPTSITTLTDGTSEQDVTILCGDANTTVKDGSDIKLAAPFICVPGNVLRVTFDGATWVETSRTNAPAPTSGGLPLGANVSASAVGQAAIGAVLLDMRSHLPSTDQMPGNAASAPMVPAESNISGFLTDGLSQEETVAPPLPVR